jgi:hypothetical protein
MTAFDETQHYFDDAITSRKTINPDTGNLKPVMGYRFIINGDFDGDGKQEQLTEHYYSSIDHTETNKWYANIDYEDVVRLTMQKEPYTFLTSDNHTIDTFQITNAPQQSGLAFLKNEGDLNGDGTDEISYVVNWADWSSLNTWYIATYKDKKWQTLYSFPIWDWLLPDLPGTTSQYGLLGLGDKRVLNAQDSIDIQLKEELLNFEGLVKKTGDNTIRIIYRNEEAEMDSTVVNLKLLEKELQHHH